MATRRERCQWCGVKLLVPLQAQTIRCPYCERSSELRPLFSDAYDNNVGMSVPNSNSWSRPDYVSPHGRIVYGHSYHQMPIQVSPPNVHGRRRAVLCGISYKGHPKALKGSINDVLSMKYLLVQRLGFPNDSVILLTEEERDPYRVPTKRNIQAALRWLVQGCQPGDSLVFHYSGHGARVRDRDGDEWDGHDEALCPVDYETEGKILDDWINDTIVWPLPRGATLHAVIDTCYSGTFLDLRYMCRMTNKEGNYFWEDHKRPFAAYKGTKGGLAVSISACDDHQNSGETPIITGTETGALTCSFIQILERKEPGLTYGYLLSALRQNIHNAQNGLSRGRVATTSVQEPQLSSSELFDIHSKQLLL